MIMKKASVFLKRIVSPLGSIAKAKSIALKSKTNEVKAWLMVLSLMKRKKVLELPGSISNKIHTFLLRHHHDNDNDDAGDQSKATVPNNNNSSSNINNASTSGCRDYGYEDGDDEGDKYRDPTHSLFDDEEEELDDPGGSIIDLVKNLKELADGEAFSLEDEIDHVADLFITRFHKQMRLQKLESFKRYQEMLREAFK